MKKLKIALLFLCFAIAGCCSCDKGGAIPVTPSVSTNVSVAGQEISASADSVKDNMKDMAEPWFPYYLENEIGYIKSISGAPSEEGKTKAADRLASVKENFAKNKPEVDKKYAESRKFGEGLNKKVKESINNLIEAAILKFQAEKEEERKGSFLLWCLGLAFSLVIAGIPATYVAYKTGRKPILGRILFGTAVVVAFLPRLLDVKWFMPSLAGIAIFLVLAYIFEAFFHKKKDEKKAAEEKAKVVDEKPVVPTTETSA